MQHCQKDFVRRSSYFMGKHQVRRQGACFRLRYNAKALNVIIQNYRRIPRRQLFIVSQIHLSNLLAIPPAMPKKVKKEPTPVVKALSARITVQDIANAAGVSIGTVSTVLQNRHIERRIPLQTVNRVRETAASLGYLPNINARRLRSLKSEKNNVVLALLTSFEAPLNLVKQFLTELRRAAMECPQTANGITFSMVIELFPAGHLSEMAGLMTGDHCNAAVIMNTTQEDDRFLASNHPPFPVVLVNRNVQGYSSVLSQPGSGKRALEILAQSRCKKPTILRGNPLTQSTQRRLESFSRSCMETFGSPMQEIVAQNLSEEAGYTAMKDFLRKGGKCDGLYAVSDALCMGAYLAIREAGLRIPKDIAVVGVGDYDYSDYFDPPLTTVGARHDLLAKKAGQMLIHHLFHATALPEVEHVQTREVLRDSAGS